MGRSFNLFHLSDDIFILVLIDPFEGADRVSPINLIRGDSDYGRGERDVKIGFLRGKVKSHKLCVKVFDDSVEQGSICIFWYLLFKREQVPDDSHTSKEVAFWVFELGFATGLIDVDLLKRLERVDDVDHLASFDHHSDGVPRVDDLHRKWYLLFVVVVNGLVFFGGEKHLVSTDVNLT